MDDAVSQTANWAGSRLLLRRLRDVMAGGGTAQQRLDRIVQLIARDLVAEVCSIYVRRAGDVLELFATEGLKAEAVHRTRLRVGEGIVGEIAAYARPTALADAQSHPNFAYRPETGEEAYKSMMGVPILRGGRLLGVLAIQNRTPRHYTDEEVETLETVGMVTAELIASGELIGRKEQAPADGIGLKPLRLEGVKMSGGMAMGRAYTHRTHVTIAQIVAEDPETENTRLETALDAMHRRLDAILETAHAENGRGSGNRTASNDTTEHLDILRTFRMIAEDRGWIKRIKDAIATGLTAEGAVVRVRDETRARMSKITDAYLRERLNDLEELATRLLQHLAGGDEASVPDPADLPDETILIADQLGPAELLEYDRTKLRGVVLEEGSATAHVAIVARALDIPVVGRVKDVLERVEPYDRIIVDGNNAVCFVRPGEEFKNAFRDSMALYAEERAQFLKERNLPSVTRDGVEIDLMMNAGLLIDMGHLSETGAAGVGLYRTEVPFMVRPSFPDVATQADLYEQILDQAAGKPVVFRTLDIGGDKVLPYFEDPEEENPAMGWRAIRISLDRPTLLRTQLRAIVKASAGRDISVMFPMIAHVGEFDAAKKILNKELDRAGLSGRGKQHVRVGAMLEVPALAFQLEALARRADFVSIGTNDLLQFLFASDRGNPKLSGRYDPLSPPALALIRQIVETCAANHLELSVCGEMAGHPVQAMTLIGLGLRRLSMTPGAIGPVRRMVRSLDVGKLEDYLPALLEADGGSLTTRLTGFARDHGITI